jgi:transcriptional regulator with XRE-family HTH domain
MSKPLASILRKLRLAKSLSQEELSFKCVIPTSQIGRFERGERSPTLNTIRVLAEGLGEEPKLLLDFKYKAKKDQ